MCPLLAATPFSDRLSGLSRYPYPYVTTFWACRRTEKHISIGRIGKLLEKKIRSEKGRDLPLWRQLYLLVGRSCYAARKGKTKVERKGRRCRACRVRRVPVRRSVYEPPFTAWSLLFFAFSLPVSNYFHGSLTLKFVPVPNPAYLGRRAWRLGTRNFPHYQTLLHRWH